MTSSRFSADDWIDRLTPALSNLAKVQVSYLEEYYIQNPSVQVFEERDGNKPVFPLDDLRDLYAMARHGDIHGEAMYYAPLCEVLDPVRHILRSHPTLARVISPIIGKDEFILDILSSGGLTNTTDLIAGLMARAAELSQDGLRIAAAELNGLLCPIPVKDQGSVPGDLDVGYDAVIFYGLTFKERIDIADGMMVLPFEQTRRFVSERSVNELAPPGAGIHDWASLGALVRPFRWRPSFYQTGYLWDRELRDPGPFFRDALVLLDLLAIAHAMPVLHLATMSNRIDQSAGRLLGLTEHIGNYNRGRSGRIFDGFDFCPEPAPEALDEVREAFKNRKGDRYARVATDVCRLSEALVRDGRFPDEDRFVKVAITLERMYDLPERRVSLKLQNRASSYLGIDLECRERIQKGIKEFYNTRSNIAHKGSDNVSPQKRSEAFDNGFDIARQSLFKLLREGPPENWDELVAPNTGPHAKVDV